MEKVRLRSPTLHRRHCSSRARFETVGGIVLAIFLFQPQIQHDSGLTWFLFARGLAGLLHVVRRSV